MAKKHLNEFRLTALINEALAIPQERQLHADHHCTVQHRLALRVNPALVAVVDIQRSINPGYAGLRRVGKRLFACPPLGKLRVSFRVGRR
jgi:hypothetical protein